MSVPMPAVVVLVVCKTVLAGEPDPNAGYTHAENRAWATENSKMICRRHEVQLYDPAVDQGADPRPFTTQDCQKAGMMLGVQWNEQHRSSSYRFWKAACPVKIVDTRSGQIIGWKLPECGHRDTVICETDIEI